MSEKKKTSTVLIAGNGPSRLDFDLNKLRDQNTCELYSCNLSHANITPGGLNSDLVFAIDKGVYEHIKDTCPAVELGDEWIYEPYEMWKSDSRPFNNSGSIAIQWAIKQDKKYIHLFGFDCLLATNNSIDNIYSGQRFYENKLTHGENLYRINYLKWIIESNPSVNFYTYYSGEVSCYDLNLSNLEYRNGI